MLSWPSLRRERDSRLGLGQGGAARPGWQTYSRIRCRQLAGKAEGGTSCSQPGPAGGQSTSVGSHGRTKPRGWDEI